MDPLKFERVGMKLEKCWNGNGVSWWFLEWIIVVYIVEKKLF